MILCYYSVGMVRFTGYFKKTAYRSLAAFMAVWLSGVVFLFCCPAMASASAKVACPLAAVSDHCKRASKQSDSGESMAGLSTKVCCDFLPAVFDKARKIEKSDRLAVAVSKPIVTLPGRVLVNRRQAALKIRQRLIDRRGIFIHNRVLRI